MSKIEDKVKLLPQKPGVYLMKDETGKIIYVGKAKILKNRVPTYFRALPADAFKTKKLVEKIADFDYIVTSTELEALVLENSLIKHHQPRYNILLKDDKNYPYVKIDIKKPYPKIEYVRKREEDGALYFGPYSGSIRNIVGTVQKAYRLPDCNREFPKDIGKQRPCLLYSINDCCGPCTGKITKEEYNELILEVVDFFEGRFEDMINILQQKMEQASENLLFEKAVVYRDRINALSNLFNRQKVVSTYSDNKDVIAYASLGNKGCFEVMVIRGGRIIDRQGFIVDDALVTTEEAAFAGFLPRYYDAKTEIPPKIVISGKTEDKELIESFLTNKRGKKCAVMQNPRGEQKKLCSMVMENALDRLRITTTREEKNESLLIELMKLLDLPSIPVTIEAVDISNLRGTDCVGAIVRFTDAIKDKNGYKRFAIRTIEGQDDYGAMREVINRRLNNYKSGEKGFEILPDLLLVDGGHAHCSEISKVVEKQGMPIPVYGMVKDSKHRTRALCDKDGREAALQFPSPLFSLIARIQDEVHRFAITYHKIKKSSGIKSKLTDIPFISDVRAEALLRKYKSIKAISEASLEDIAKTEKMDKRSALSLKEHLNK